MRTRILAACCTVISLAPLATLRAQEASDAEAQETQDETEATEVVDAPEEQAVPAVAHQPAGAPGTQHTVSAGDTLWDLTQRYLGSPWYWPKVWSYNPEIANPHYIYPGNQVRFFATGEEVPTRVDVAQASTQLPTFDDAAQDVSGLLDRVPEDLVTVAGPLVYAGTPTFPVATEGFVTEDEVGEAGTLEAAGTFGSFLSTGDTVYVRFRDRANARVGDRYSIFRTDKKVKHPVTGRSVGYLTHILGTLVVTEVTPDKLVTAHIVSSRDAISRGDHVGPAGEQEFTRVQRRPNQASLEGNLVTGMVPYLTFFGDMQRVFVDKGSADGVQPGNTFTFTRQNDPGKAFLDPARARNHAMPVYDIGECIVLDVKEQVSSCLITRSRIEVVPGDRAVMRVEGPRTARR